MKNFKFFVIIFLDELGLLLSILGLFKDFLEISLISLISANLPLPKKEANKDANKEKQKRVSFRVSFQALFPPQVLAHCDT